MTTRYRFISGAVACATLLCAGTTLATQSAQEKCDSARITAWKTYLSCVDTVVAKDAGCYSTGCPASFDEFAAFAKCRHTYFKNWTAFQGKAYAGSTCAAGVSNRFTVTDSGATVTDALTGLVWELKTNDASVHGGAFAYTWSTEILSPWAEDGTAFTDFLTTGLNVPGFAGANGWRIPSLAELQTILADFPCTPSSCTCGSTPCIAFNDPNTQPYSYWSATSYVPNPFFAWSVGFHGGAVYNYNAYNYKTWSLYFRAVRGGL